MAYVCDFTLWINSHNSIGIDGLADPVDSGNIADPDNPTVFINNATLTVEAIKDPEGENLLGTPVSMAYIAGSDGKYRGSVDGVAIGLQEKVIYEVEMKATEPGGLTFTWYPRANAEKRRI